MRGREQKWRRIRCVEPKLIGKKGKKTNNMYIKEKQRRKSEWQKDYNEMNGIYSKETRKELYIN